MRRPYNPHTENPVNYNQAIDLSKILTTNQKDALERVERVSSENKLAMSFVVQMIRGQPNFDVSAVVENAYGLAAAMLAAFKEPDEKDVETVNTIRT